MEVVWYNFVSTNSRFSKMDNNSIIFNIRHYRNLRGMSQRELSESSGINLKTLQRYESGETPILKDDAAWLLSGALKISVEELLLGYKPSRDAAKEVQENKQNYEAVLAGERAAFEEKLRQKDKEISLLEKNNEDLRSSLERAHQMNRMYERRLSDHPENEENPEK